MQWCSKFDVLVAAEEAVERCAQQAALYICCCNSSMIIIIMFQECKTCFALIINLRLAVVLTLFACNQTGVVVRSEVLVFLQMFRIAVTRSVKHSSHFKSVTYGCREDSSVLKRFK